MALVFVVVGGSNDAMHVVTPSAGNGASQAEDDKEECSAETAIAS